MDFERKAYEYADSIIRDLTDLISIKSVKDPKTSGAGKPMGEEIGRALTDILGKCRRDGFRIANLDGYAGYAEYGPEDAEDYIAVLCHLDVVPAEGEWSYPPYRLIVEDGKLIGRGVLDDKGPAVAALYALNILKDCKPELKHRIRLIFGTDEESGCECISRYKSVEKMPLCGFSPDADFPIVNAEKGQINTRIVLTARDRKIDGGLYRLEEFRAGGIANMVAEKAEAVISGELENLVRLEKAFTDYCKKNNIVYAVIVEEGSGRIILKAAGRTAHGMEPEKGVHAGLELAHFLAGVPFEGSNAEDFISCLDHFLYNDYTGKNFGVEAYDAGMGPLTINSGIQQYSAAGEKYFHINLRFPSCCKYEDIIEGICGKISDRGFTADRGGMTVKLPHLVPESHPMIGILKNAYRSITGNAPELISTGGGTYAAHMGNSVAFGPLFPGREETAHRADEYIYLDDLIKAAAIYARAMYDLGSI